MTFKTQVDWLMGAQEILDHLYGTSSCPNVTVKPAEYATWTKLDAKGKSLLGSALPNNLVRTCQRAKTLHEIWIIILSKFEMKTTLGKEDMKLKLDEMSCNEKEIS